MLSTLMYIHTNHAEMNTSKPRNKSIMRRFLNTEGLTGSLSSLGNKFQNGAGPE